MLKTLFVHIPKTGGTSIQVFLDKTDYVMYGHKRLTREKGREYGNHFKFTFVRNPWSRIASGYIHAANSETGFRARRKLEVFTGGFKKFLNILCGRGEFPHSHIAHMRNKQLIYFLDRGIETVDYIGRHETLRRDFSQVLRHVGYDRPIGELGKERYYIDYDYRDLYDEEAKKMVAKYYEEEIDYLKYTFNGNGHV